MELQEYAKIIWRRAWLPLALVALVAAVSLLTRQTPAPLYTASLRFVVGVQPEQVSGQFNYDGYYAGISSEFVADDLSVVVSSRAFAEDVTRHLAEAGSGVSLPPGVISGMTFADKQHRVLQLTLTWGNPDELQAIGNAVVQTIQQDAGKYLAQLGVFNGQIVVIDPLSSPAPIPPSLTQRLDLPVRLLLALVAGVALTFLWHYLDPAIRTPAELDSLGVVTLGNIPRR